MDELGGLERDVPVLAAQPGAGDRAQLVVDLLDEGIGALVRGVRGGFTGGPFAGWRIELVMYRS